MSMSMIHGDHASRRTHHCSRAVVRRRAGQQGAQPAGVVLPDVPVGQLVAHGVQVAAQDHHVDVLVPTGGRVAQLQRPAARDPPDEGCLAQQVEHARHGRVVGLPRSEPPLELPRR